MSVLLPLAHELGVLLADELPEHVRGHAGLARALLAGERVATGEEAHAQF